MKAFCCFYCNCLESVDQFVDKQQFINIEPLQPCISLLFINILLISVEVLYFIS